MDSILYFGSTILGLPCMMHDLKAFTQQSRRVHVYLSYVCLGYILLMMVYVALKLNPSLSSLYSTHVFPYTWSTTVLQYSGISARYSSNIIGFILAFC